MGSFPKPQLIPNFYHLAITLQFAWYVSFRMQTVVAPGGLSLENSSILLSKNKNYLSYYKLKRNAIAG